MLCLWVLPILLIVVLTVAGVVLFALLKYNQVPNIYGLIGIVLIIIGVVMVNYLGRLN
jgi:small multidrug resistance pump